MSVRVRDTLGAQLGHLRHEPTTKHVRAQIDGEVVVDSNRAVLVWEPRRVVPTYAVPVEDLRRVEVSPAPLPSVDPDGASGFGLPDVTALPVLDPRIPFAVHTAAGQPVALRSGDDRTLAGFTLDDPDLAGYVVLDFDEYDTWLEEDDPVIGHPQDPFHRIDTRGSSRHIQVLLDGQVLADTTRARLVFETMLPVRYYLPFDDVLAKLVPSPTSTVCAYKGSAQYWSVNLGGRIVDDLLWSYPEPLLDAARLTDHVAFFDERTDLVVDGVPRPRPQTPWS